MKTRTFAEICARQGQLPEAIEIYQALIVKSPDDPQLRTRLAELERELAGLADGLLPGAALAASTSPERPPPPEPPPRPLPTDLPPLASRSTRAKKKSGAGAVTATSSDPAATDAELIARARRLERLEKLLYRIQNRRRRAHS